MLDKPDESEPILDIIPLVTANDLSIIGG